MAEPLRLDAQVTQHGKELVIVPDTPHQDQETPFVGTELGIAGIVLSCVVLLLVLGANFRDDGGSPSA